MAIDYKPVGWSTADYINPSNMNQMDNGIKAACDGVDKLNENVIGTVLWTNPDSTVEFGAQTITLAENISNYAYYDIEYCYASSSSTNRSIRFKTGKIPKAYRTRLMMSAGYNLYRNINIPSEKSMEISDCNRVITYGKSDTEIANSMLIPIRVIGYKNL